MQKEKLKLWRKDMGWTQTDLAEWLGYERWTIMKWEQGKTRIPKWMWIVMGLIQKEHIRGINENTQRPLSNRGKCTTREGRFST